MAGLGGMLAAAILKVVGDQVGAAIGGQIKLHKNFDKELKKMKMALESVDALLEDAGRRSITDKSTLLWLKRLKDALYAISDMIDEFETDTEAISRPSARKFSFKKYLAIMIPCLTIIPKITMANKMEKMREDLEVITDQHNKFKLTEGTSTNQPKVIDIRETTSIVETQIVGRTKDKDEILAFLSESMTEEITILPICGIGGLGKTTLAKMVYNSSQFKEYSQVWVYVSQTFDLKNIGNSIISQLLKEKKESEYTRMQMITNSLQELLANKKILIVLDDLWEGEVFHLKSLSDMLKVGKCSNVVVIVTTRDEDIANKISTIKPYKLAPLTDDVCWSIIKQKSAFESRGDKEQLEEIGKAIAVKCGGVALASNSLGHMLQSMNPSEWESVRDNDIWNAPSSVDPTSSQVLASLKLSYSVMPSYLKLCFAYCAIFPKGHKIVKDDLIHQWVSLGFSTWQLGEKYISQLLGFSFLEHSKSTSTVKLYEDITLLTMHDLVHDLARSVMDDELLVVGKDDDAEGSCYHYALLDDCSNPLSSGSSKIRALCFTECGKIELHGSAFSSAKSLRVLDLSECIINKLPDSIGVLKQLRYLNAPRIQHATIPDCITRLSKLIYLNLHGSPAIVVLPESIGEIEGLAYLDLSGCSTLGKLPESFGRLKELVRLDLSNCFCVGDISKFLESLTQLQHLDLSYCRNIGGLPEALGSLCKLQYLDLSFSSYLDSCEEAEVLGALDKLEYLNLSSKKCCLQKLPEALGGFIQLKYLNLSGCFYLKKLPRLIGSLRNLVHLDLSFCHSVDYRNEPLVGLSNLQHLELEGTCVSLLPDGLTKIRYLNLSSLWGMSEDTVHSLINHISGNFPDLQHLDLSYNSYIKSIPESLCTLRKLHTLNLSSCIYLQKMPENICTIESLKFLYLNGCDYISKLPQLGSNAISLPHFVVQPGNNDSSSNLIQLQQVDPAELRISKLENVKSAAEAHHIKLMEKKSLYDLTLEWTGDVERIVDDRVLLENLVPPSTLKKLEICGCNIVSFPAWLVLGQLPQLKSLVLRGMTNLEEWNTSYSSGEEHVIERLEIHDCPLLRMGPLPPRAEKWVISNSDNVLSSWEECTGPHTNATTSSSFSPIPPSTLKELEICGYNGVSFPAWLVLDQPQLKSLVLRGMANLEEWNTSYSSVEEHVIEKLEIHDCPMLRIGPLPPKAKKWVISDSDNVLSSWEECTGRYLRIPVTTELSVQNCMVPMQQWRLLQHFPGLTSLSIKGSVDLTGSPEVTQHLSSLKTLWLEVQDLEELPKWLKENKGQLTKLTLYGCDSMASLPHWLGELTSLKELHIWCCAALSSLPESIRQLTGLQELQIDGCPELKCLVERGCLLPTSLENLVIWDCNGIKSFPEGMEQLTSLTKLDICECPDLKLWCELEENKMMLAHIEKSIFAINSVPDKECCTLGYKNKGLNQPARF